MSNPYGVIVTVREKRRRSPMPSRFDKLATYNAERARGIAHTPEWDAAMAELQREYDEQYRWRPQGDCGCAYMQHDHLGLVTYRCAEHADPSPCGTGQGEHPGRWVGEGWP